MNNWWHGWAFDTRPLFATQLGSKSSGEVPRRGWRVEGGRCPFSQQLTKRGQTGCQVGSSGQAVPPRRRWLCLPLHPLCHSFPTAFSVDKLGELSLPRGRQGRSLPRPGAASPGSRSRHRGCRGPTAVKSRLHKTC